jgi:hypothetical protein
MTQLEIQFIAIVNEQSLALPKPDVDEIRSLVDDNELGVAFENFCTQLYEYDAPCTSEQIHRIAALGLALKVSPRYWEILRRSSQP